MKEKEGKRAPVAYREYREWEEYKELVEAVKELY